MSLKLRRFLVAFGWNGKFRCQQYRSEGHPTQAVWENVLQGVSPVFLELLPLYRDLPRPLPRYALLLPPRRKLFPLREPLPLLLPLPRDEVPFSFCGAL